MSFIISMFTPSSTTIDKLIDLKDGEDGKLYPEMKDTSTQTDLIQVYVVVSGNSTNLFEDEKEAVQFHDNLIDSKLVNTNVYKIKNGSVTFLYNESAELIEKISIKTFQIHTGLDT